jgi:hypothetical protein
LSWTRYGICVQSQISAQGFRPQFSVPLLATGGQPVNLNPRHPVAALRASRTDHEDRQITSCYSVRWAPDIPRPEASWPRTSYTSGVHEPAVDPRQIPPRALPIRAATVFHDRICIWRLPRGNCRNRRVGLESVLFLVVLVAWVQRCACTGAYIDGPVIQQIEFGTTVCGVSFHWCRRDIDAQIAALRPHLAR